MTRRWPDADGFVRELHVERVHIGLRINRETANAQLLAGADDAESDFATVGDEDLFKHQRRRWGAADLRHSGSCKESGWF
jgi:hypothetical protein